MFSDELFENNQYALSSLYFYKLSIKFDEECIGQTHYAICDVNLFVMYIIKLTYILNKENKGDTVKNLLIIFTALLKDRIKIINSSQVPFMIKLMNIAPCLTYYYKFTKKLKLDR